MPVAAGGGSAAAASTVYRKPRPAPVDPSAEAPAPSYTKRRSFEPPPEYRFSWVARACRQDALRKGYRNPSVQWAIAFLIMGNFMTNIIEKQIDPTGLEYAKDWTVIENIWNSVFVVELLWNMAAHWALTVSAADVSTWACPRGRVHARSRVAALPMRSSPRCAALLPVFRARSLRAAPRAPSPPSRRASLLALAPLRTPCILSHFTSPSSPTHAPRSSPIRPQQTWSWRETSPPYKERISHFVCSSWNIFDFVVVGVSVPSLLGIDLGSFSQLRMLRAFRVFRLFKRIKSLNKIIVSLANAVPGLINAAIVQILVMCIYAILGVDLFRDFGKDMTYVNIANETVPILTARGMTYGDEYYGNFFRSLYTLFQVVTGESWSEAVGRPIIMSTGANQYVGAIYFVSYIIVCGIILVNVSVAVLLEKMVASPEEEEDDGTPAGINLAELPPHLQLVLAPLDLDGDGYLTTVELHKAADLLKREQADPGAAAAAAGDGVQAQQIADLVTSQMMALGGPPAPASAPDSATVLLEELREEGRRREAMLREHFEEARLRAEIAEQQLASLLHAAQVTQQAVLRTKARSRPRMGTTRPAAPPPPPPPPPPPDRPNGPGVPGCGAGGGSYMTMSDDEDREQDGEHTLSKQAPERLRSASGTIHLAA